MRVRFVCYLGRRGNAGLETTSSGRVRGRVRGRIGVTVTVAIRAKNMF